MGKIQVDQEEYELLKRKVAALEAWATKASARLKRLDAAVFYPAQASETQDSPFGEIMGLLGKTFGGK